ncbi:MAG TPA: ABC transporter permease [Gaiellaceae bacterium]|nr:ABC transporter permease [Gaiellaceae bacterium]
MKSARLLVIGWFFQLKMLSRSSFNGILGILYPLFFATVAFLMYRAGSPNALLYASLGASVMGVWSAVSTSAGSAMQRERWQGTLELLVSAPAHFSLVMLPVTVAMSTIGLYSMAATLLWGWLLFGIDLHVAHPLLFCVSIVVTVVSIGVTGFLMAVAFVRYRTAWALGNLFEYPVWLVAGFLVPISLFPGWVRPISWLLAPTWGMNAIRESALGGTPLPDVGLCAAIGVGCLVLGIAVTGTVLRSARARATLALT